MMLGVWGDAVWSEVNADGVKDAELKRFEGVGADVRTDVGDCVERLKIGGERLGSFICPCAVVSNSLKLNPVISYSPIRLLTNMSLVRGFD